MVILGYFLPFYPPKNSINQNFEKMKNFTGKTFTHVYQKITIMYSSWDTEWDRQNFLSFWVILCPFNKILKNEKWKKCLEILSFYKYMCTKNEDHMIYGSWSLRHNRQIFVILGHSLPFQPPDNLENQNFKIDKNTWRYYNFTHLQHKWQSYDVCFLRYWVRQTDFFVILDHFLLFYPLPWKIKILKNWKNTWRYHHFTQVYQKSWSYAILFLIHGAWQM